MRSSSDPIFVTTVYGSDYLPFLAPHLYSVSQCHPGATKLVLWQDLPPHEIDLLSRAFPDSRFLQIEEDTDGDLNQKIARKLHCWHLACHLYPDDPLCFIDCDTLLVKPIGRFLTPDFDVLFTWKNEVFPINTGVVLVRNGRTADPVFDEWATLTESIVTNSLALSKALAVSGAADQHALREIIGFVNYDGVFTRTVLDRAVVFKGVPCRLLNETNCVPLTDETYIIHYKAGWHPIILHREEFSEHRPEDKCREMYNLWLKISAEANGMVGRALVTHSTRKYVDRFREVIDSYEERGILHSEMLAVCAVCDELDVEVIIESGRCRGQSTLVLARYFQGHDTTIISIELERDENALFAAQRLAPYNHVQLIYGDSQSIMPTLIQQLTDKRIAILLDGPKGQVAIDLLRGLLSDWAHIVSAFFHDTRKATPQRCSLEDVFARVVFTDDEEYVRSYAKLDLACLPKPGDPITIHTWRPYMKGDEPIDSYGPTLAIVFPTSAERLTDENHEGIKSKGPVELVRAFYHLAMHEGLRPALRQTVRWAHAKVDFTAVRHDRFAR